MKNFFKSKGFIVTSLAVLCITILGVCWYAGQDKSDPFLPDESPPARQRAPGLKTTHRQTAAMGQMPMSPHSLLLPLRNILK